MEFNWKLLLAISLFGLCVAPTIVSYQPYKYQYDDSGYLVDSINTSRAFWSGDLHALGKAIYGIHPPIMALTGVPWGTLVSWDAAGKCLLSLATLTAFFAACCLFLMLRCGLKPLYLVIGSVSLLAGMGPFPGGSDAHYVATSFMADTLFAWIAFAALLLIPYEIASDSGFSTRDGLARGLLWALIFSAGAVTKVNFFYFIAAIVPVLFVIRLRKHGFVNTCAVLLSLAICSFPAILYWVRFGAFAFRFAWSSSFGHIAPHFRYPLPSFLGHTVQLSPGLFLSAALILGELIYLLVKRRDITWGGNTFSLLILAGYCAVALASSNREIRFLFTAVIALPFLIGIIVPDSVTFCSQKAALSASVMAFCCLVVAAVPVLGRAERDSIQRAEVVLAHAISGNAKHILLASDSPTLNLYLLRLAILLSPSRSSVETATLAWPPLADLPIEDDFRAIRESDLVVFQNKAALDLSLFTNGRVLEYEQYAQQSGDGPIKLLDDVSVYTMHHGPRWPAAVSER